MEPLCHICRMSYSPRRAEIDEMLEDLRKLGTERDGAAH